MKFKSLPRTFLKVRGLHGWNVTPKKAIDIQKRLAREILLKNTVRKLNYIGGIDVSYRDGRSFACACILKYPGLRCVEYKTASCKTKFPYIPGLLTFREGPAIIKCIKKIAAKPDVFIFDGQGIAHPRMLGLATHIGILLDTPSIGCAKSFLYGEYNRDPGLKKGSFSFLKAGNKKIGVVLRTRDNTNPMFISPGHKIDLSASIEIVLKSLRGFRIPEPLRLAHRYSKLGGDSKVFGKPYSFGYRRMVVEKKFN